MPPASGRWLLIGNSRWHWAELSPAGGPLRHRHAPAPPGSAEENPAPVDWSDLVAWAAVGPVQDRWGLPAERRIDRAAVPLGDAPPWLGIDRALAGWEAWRQQRERQPGGAVLVADAGTVLSLTRVDGQGRFRGGRLQAGVALQLRAMAEGTEALPALPLDLAALDPPALDPGPGDPWPRDTAAAMAVGVLRGLAAAVRQACRELADCGEPASLWLTGGDAPRLAPLLTGAALPLHHAPELVLEALVALSSDPGRRGSHRPGSRC